MQILLTVVRSLILPTLVFPVSLQEARNFLNRFSKNTHTSNFLKTRLVGAELSVSKLRKATRLRTRLSRML